LLDINIDEFGVCNSGSVLQKIIKIINMHGKTTQNDHCFCFVFL
jgi:hypothetical protein